MRLRRIIFIVLAMLISAGLGYQNYAKNTGSATETAEINSQSIQVETSNTVQSKETEANPTSDIGSKK